MSTTPTHEELMKELEGVTVTYSDEYDPTPEELALNRKQALCLYLFFKDRIGETKDADGNVMRVSNKYEIDPCFRNTVKNTEEGQEKMIRFWQQMFIKNVVPIGPEKSGDRFGDICLLGNTPVREDNIAEDEEIQLLDVNRWRNPDFDPCHLLMLTCLMTDGSVRNMMFSRLNVWRATRHEIVDHYFDIINKMSDADCAKFADAYGKARDNFAPVSPAALTQ